jgi:lipopolysaccharide/colanic/teichoic acid biosynthesis glycosyltransferase
MSNRIKISPYHLSLSKKVIDYAMATIGLFILAPITIILYPIIKLNDGGSVFFTQKRSGKYGKTFTMFKFRTMNVNAEKLRGIQSLEKQNISDGPVFKIPDDPRLTGIGKYLWKSGLDELPQLINILKGEMSIVGPRPFPVYEANKLTKFQKIRELVLPGITSSWIINGAHRIKFSQWMKLDREYVENASFHTDVSIMLNTLKIIVLIMFNKIKKLI